MATSRPSTSLQGYAWLSVVTALLTMFIKFSAYAITDSVGLLSDALESLVNLSAAVLAVFMLRGAAGASGGSCLLCRYRAREALVRLARRSSGPPVRPPNGRPPGPILGRPPAAPG
ncbi:cation transporter [bacterium]|nr:cation transporter [bacterium]